MKPVIRSLIKRYPKLRGYKFNPQTTKPVVINFEVLEKKFKSGDKVSPKILLEKGLIRKIKGRMPLVKILGKGKIAKALTIEGCSVSKSVKEKLKTNAVAK